MTKYTPSWKLPGPAIKICNGFTLVAISLLFIATGHIQAQTTGQSFGSELNGSGLLRLSIPGFPDFASGTFVQTDAGTVCFADILAHDYGGDPADSVKSAMLNTVGDIVVPKCHTTQDFCAIDEPTVADLDKTGEIIKWYISETGGTELADSIPLTTGTYYGSQMIDGKESTTRLVVLVTVHDPALPSGETSRYFCAAENGTVGDLVAIGENIRWYDTATGGTALTESTPLITSIYYASQTVDGCESIGRLAVVVTVTDPEAPEGNPDQGFCAINEPVISDLEANGSNILWYDVAAGGTALTGSVPLATDIYYASQTINGCESNDRLAVSVTIFDPPAPSGNTDQFFCSGDDPVVADLEATGSVVRWYNTSTGGTALLPATHLISGTYYASQTAGGCESTARFMTTVTVGETPVTSAITGETEPECNAAGMTYSVVLTTGSTYSWNVPPGASIVSGTVGPDNNTIVVDFGTQDGYIEVTETNSLGCTGLPVQLYIDMPECGPIADFLANDTEVCQDEDVIFTDHSQGTTTGTAYSWNFGSGAVPLTANTAGPHTVHYSTSGYKTVQLTVTNTVSGTTTKTDYILVNPNPTVDLGNDTTICYGNSLVLDAGYFISYMWSTGATTGSIIVNESAGIVSVTVTDENGCQGSDEIVIRDCDPAVMLGRIPNVFTPNNDNIHDSWVIPNIHLFPDVNIKIYDRWGRLVFVAEGGYENDWYGTGPDGNDLPVDTYYYIIDLNVPGTEPFKGTVSIIR
ncbi:MAG: gliding motility-associated C-terminal domain-containing protein [Bacteroidales bacterium]|nr:gliding motility-associated C-terminal domain-containing protein [Bacteroidales bacterium]